MVSKKMNYNDIFVVEDFDEAEQFRYESDNQQVEIGTPVGYLSHAGDLICYDGIYYCTDNEV